MRNQTATVLAIAGVGIAGLSFSIVPSNPAQARECLAAPSAATPPGSQWRYRTDHALKRQCWYLRGADDAAAPRPSSAGNASDDPAEDDDTTSALGTPADTALQPSIANARAEYLPPSARSGSPAARADSTQNWPLDQRWSNVAQFDAAAAAPLRDAAETDLQPAASTAAPPPAAAPAAALPAAPLAATATAPGKGPTSTSTLLGALVAALGVSGLIVGLTIKLGSREPLFKFGRKRRRDIWGDVDKARDAVPEPVSPYEPLIEAPRPQILDLDLLELEAHEFDANEPGAVDFEFHQFEAYDFELDDFVAGDFEFDEPEARDGARDFDVPELAAHDFESIKLEGIKLEAIDLQAIAFEANAYVADGRDAPEIEADEAELPEAKVYEPPQWIRAARERQISMRVVPLAPEPVADDVDDCSDEIEALLMRAQRRPAAG